LNGSTAYSTKPYSLLKFVSHAAKLFSGVLLRLMGSRPTSTACNHVTGVHLSETGGNCTNAYDLGSGPIDQSQKMMAAAMPAKHVGAE
jgi:hypothetical protein